MQIFRCFLLCMEKERIWCHVTQTTTIKAVTSFYLCIDSNEANTSILALKNLFRNRKKKIAIHRWINFFPNLTKLWHLIHCENNGTQEIEIVCVTTQLTSAVFAPTVFGFSSDLGQHHTQRVSGSPASRLHSPACIQTAIYLASSKGSLPSVTFLRNLVWLPQTADEMKPVITCVPPHNGRCFLPGGGKGDSFCWPTECQERSLRPFITGVPPPDVHLLDVTCKGLLWNTVIVSRHLNCATLRSKAYWLSWPSVVFY